MALKDEVKLELRIKTVTFDSEIDGLIAEAKMKIKLCGVLATLVDTPDALISRAIKLYCKANFGLNNEDSDKYEKSFIALVTHLTLCSEYTEEVV